MQVRRICALAAIAIGLVRAAAAHDGVIRAAGGTGNCTLHNGVSYHNPEGRIGETLTGDGVSPETCCAHCFRDFRCQSWTFWQDQGGVPSCNLFRNVSGAVECSTRQTCSAGVAVAKPKPPNFIFYFPDTLRAESFNAYGLKVANVTPNVDRLAAQGTMFNQAHVMHTQCSPSRCTMFTGRYMHVLGHRTQTHLIQDYEPNYLRTLKEAGYHVQYYGKNDAFSANAFNLSVSNWTGMIGYASGGNAYSFGDAGYFSFLSTGSNTSGTDLKNADYHAAVEAVRWLQDSPPEPFVLFMPSRGAHPPYGAPKEWQNKVSVADVQKNVKLRPPNLPNKPVYMQPQGIRGFRNLTTLPEETFQKIQAVYLGMISYTDWIFGQLLDGLDAAPGGLADRTSVFFSSDHGDFGGDFGLVEKWPGSMDDVLSRVPLVARIPGGAKGHVVQEPVQTADVLETMLDMAGLNASFVRFGQPLTKHLHGDAGDTSRVVYSEGGFFFQNEQMIEANECLSQCPKGLYCPRGQEEAQKNGSPRAVMLRNLTAKLVHRPTGVSELYDLAADPQELNNLFGAAGAAALQADMMRQLLDWLVLTSDITPEYVDPRGPPKYPHEVPPDPWAQPMSPAPSFASTQSHLQLFGDPTDLLKINGVLEE